MALLASVVLLTSHGLEVAYAGQPVGSTIFIYTDTTDNADQVHSAVAYNSAWEEYLVVWWNDRPGRDDIYGQRVSRDGMPIGHWFPVFDNPGPEMRYPDVAYNIERNEYLVVWEQEDGTLPNIRGRVLSAEGDRLGKELVLGSGSGLRSRSRPAVAYASTSDRYLVVWTSHVLGSVSNDIEGQSLLGSGEPTGGNFLIAEGTWQATPEQPDLAYNRSRNEYLVAWQQMSVDYDIYGRRVQGSGAPMGPGPFVISAQSGDDTAPAVAAIPTIPNEGQYLVVWASPWSPANVDIYGRRIRGDGSSEGPILWIAPVGGNAANPAVAGSEGAGQYLVAWNEVIFPPDPYSGVRARALTLQGELLGEGAWLWWFYSDHPAVASGPLGDFLVTFDALEVDRGIYGQLWGNRSYLPLMVR
jgi:hypothetical protein